jgi:ABC-2 type transport system ATP-binding protein
MPSSLLEIKGLVKKYGDRIAVNGIDLSILGGEVFGLLGPNGAEKSTTISIPGTLLAPDAGQIISHRRSRWYD